MKQQPDLHKPVGSGPASPPSPRLRGFDGRRLGTLAVVALVVLVGVWLASLRFTVRNPFAERTVDRSPPVLLKAIEDLSVYKAATGNFQVLVDLEKDAPLLPPLVKGERTLFLAAGNVDAEVDFSSIGKQAIKVGEDGHSATITLPRPRLAPAHLDTTNSRVVSRHRGILDRIGSVFSDNPTSERELYLLAERKISEAATQSDLVSRAEQNTRTMLQGMLRPLGYTSVTVVFTEPPVER